MGNQALFMLFATPVAFLEDFISEEERLALMARVDENDLAPHEEFTGNSVSSHNRSSEVSVNRFLPAEILDRLTRTINNFSEHYGVGRLKIDNYWVNVQNRGSTLNRHLHSGSVLSGVLYLNVNEAASKLVFWNPNPHHRFMLFDKQTELNWGSYTLKPSNGALMMWPSWLEHGSGVFDNEMDNRVSLSFNTQLDR
ncbi:MAG: hypothetical protein FJ275_00515 [Planctomycetes bacterium]|nr:hypothetical protein [Planctomycetota bacterium]